MQRLIIFFLVLASFSSKTYASFNIGYSLEELCTKSDYIVLAKVESISCFSQENEIYTSIMLRLKSSYKGDLITNGIIEILRHGGTIGEKSVIQVGAPVFKTDNEVILFLDQFVSPEFGLNYSVLGLSEGMFMISNNKVFRQQPIPLKIEQQNKTIIVTQEEPMDMMEFENSIISYLESNEN